MNDCTRMEYELSMIYFALLQHNSFSFTCEPHRSRISTLLARTFIELCRQAFSNQKPTFWKLLNFGVGPWLDFRLQDSGLQGSGIYE